MPTHAQVAAGMSRSVEIELLAMAVGAVGEGGLGSVQQHELLITSEASTMRLPITANILSTGSILVVVMQWSGASLMNPNTLGPEESVLIIKEGS